MRENVCLAHIVDALRKYVWFVTVSVRACITQAIGAMRMCVCACVCMCVCVSHRQWAHRVPPLLRPGNMYVCVCVCVFVCVQSNMLCLYICAAGNICIYVYIHAHTLCLHACA